MAVITQSITVNGDTWDVEFDDAQAVWLGADTAAGLTAQDLEYFDASNNPDCGTARRIAIAKYLGGPLPEGVS